MADTRHDYAPSEAPEAPLLRLALASLVLATTLPSPLYAHGFGQRYDLPVPLWLYLVGAGATVGLSFIMVVILMPARGTAHHQLRFSLPCGGVVGRSIIAVARVAACLLFALVVIAGLFGSQSPFKNIAPTMVWVIGWVGLSFVSALLGDVWALINPWDSLARLVERRHRGARLFAGSAPPLDRPWFDAWPSVLLFLAFAWCELIWDGSDHPRNLAVLLLAYSAVTWAGMLLLGRQQWLRSGEIFSIAFGLFSRFAPVEAFEDGEGPRLRLRPYATGLLAREPASPALTFFVLLLLATVT